MNFTEYDLKEPLEELDVKSLFQNDANLSGINGNQNLKVSSAIHKAYIEVNEEGAEAGAANGVAIENRTLPPVITIDRSFVFLIIDDKSGLILFGGQVRTLVDEETLSLGLI
jgi:serpin B